MNQLWLNYVVNQSGPIVAELARVQSKRHNGLNSGEFSYESREMRFWENYQ